MGQEASSQDPQRATILHTVATVPSEVATVYVRLAEHGQPQRVVGRLSATRSYSTFGIGSAQSVASAVVTSAVAPEVAAVQVEVCLATLPHSEAHQ